MTRLSSLLFAALLLSTLACTSATEKHLAEARQLKEEGKFVEALARFQTLLPFLDGEDKSSAEVATGECLLKLDRPREALTIFERVLEHDPMNLKARVRSAEIYLTAGAPSRANDHLRVAKVLSPRDPDVLTVEAALQANAGDLPAAERLFEQVLAADPERTGIAVVLADFNARQGKIADARAILLKSASANPQVAEPLLALARMEEQQPDPVAAEEAYRRAVAAEDTPYTNLRLAQFLQRSARIAEAEEILRKLDATSDKPSTFLADAQLASGKVGDALREYLNSLRSDKTTVPLEEAAVVARLVEADLYGARDRGPAVASRVALARSHLNNYRDQLDKATIAILEAEIALVDGDLEQARERALAGVSAAPKSAAAHYVLGLVVGAEGDFANQTAEWTKALELDPAFVPVRMVLAQRALEAGDALQAEHHAASVVRLEPGNLRALVTYARALTAKGETEAARTVAQRAEAVNPRSVEPFLVQGEIALAQSNYGEALVRYQQAVLLDPHSDQAIEGLLRVYRKGDITPHILRKMETVAQSQPPSATLMEIVGRLYAEIGRYDDAARVLERALEMDSLRGSAALALAETYSRGGADDRAAESLTRINRKTALLLGALRAQEQQRPEAAIRDYEALLRYDSGSEIVANNLAWLYAEQGEKLDRALELARTAQRLKANDPAILHTLGFVHMRRREYSQAIEILAEAESKTARTAEAGLRDAIRRDLADAYRRTGDTAAAAKLSAIQ